MKGDLYSIMQLASLFEFYQYKEETFKWYSKAASMGDPFAECYIAFAYLYARGIHKNIPEAIKWFLLLANKYDSNAQYTLGCLYYNDLQLDSNLKIYRLPL